VSGRCCKQVTTPLASGRCCKQVTTSLASGRYCIQVTTPPVQIEVVPSSQLYWLSGRRCIQVTTPLVQVEVVSRSQLYWYQVDVVSRSQLHWCQAVVVPRSQLYWFQVEVVSKSQSTRGEGRMNGALTMLYCTNRLWNYKPAVDLIITSYMSHSRNLKNVTSGIFSWGLVAIFM
jgi:hypothetical protein